MRSEADPSPSADVPAFAFDGGSGSRYCLLAAPHAGRVYGPAITDMLRVPAEHLQKLEDRYSDLLLRQAAQRGYATMVALAPRALIDLNRPLGELDFDMIEPDEVGQLTEAGLKRSRMPAARVRGGLGLVPRRLAACGELWNRRIGARELLERIANVHAPYHAALERELDAMVQRHDAAVLLDIHSMPPLPASRASGGPGGAADVVVGDLHGTSADGAVVAAVAQVAADHGLKVVRNNPYAGGHVLRRHGKPRRGRHGVQVEFDRRLYLDSRMTEPGQGLSRIAEVVAEMADAAEAAVVGNGRFAEAAE